MKIKAYDKPATLQYPRKRPKQICSILFVMLLFAGFPAAAQPPVILEANGPGNTYELINSVLAPGYNAVENPECVHPSFGRHIAEVFDATLGKNVFEFYSHVNEDNDRCVAFDRQRVEIKTYDQSPANLIGTIGETITYKWSFRLAAGFQPSTSFTHIHQIKPVDGDDGDPLFTLTPRKGAINKLELIHNNTTKVAIVDLSLFTGVWVDVTETLTVGAAGKYSMQIKRNSDNGVLLNFSSTNIMTIRPDNSFIRPKWGIYRSLNVPSDLRDESLRIATISIQENAGVVPIRLLYFNAEKAEKNVNLNWRTAMEAGMESFTVEKSADALNFIGIGNVAAAGNSNNVKDYLFTDKAPTAGLNYYRLKQTNSDGSVLYSSTAKVIFKSSDLNHFFVYPNPVRDVMMLHGADEQSIFKALVYDDSGRQIISTNGKLSEINKSINQNIGDLKGGFFYIKLSGPAGSYTAKFIKQ